MRRWHLGFKLLAAFLVLATWLGAKPAAGAGRAEVSSTRPAQPGNTSRAVSEASLERWLQTTAADFSPGTFGGTVVATAAGDGELLLQEGRAQGLYTSVAHEFSFPCRGAGLLYRGRLSGKESLSLELRAQDEDGQWTDWVGIAGGPWADPEGRSAGESLATFSPPGHLLQYRVTLSGSKVALEEVVVLCLRENDIPKAGAVPPWRRANNWPQPATPIDWGAERVPEVAVTETIGLQQVEIYPATLAASGEVAVAPALRMVQRFHREALGLNDIAYAFLVDPQGGVYQGQSKPTGTVLYIGILGAHPHEAVSPTVEDALVALLDWWRAAQPDERAGVPLVTPDDPLLAERLQARGQAGNLRRNLWYLPRGVTGPDTDEWILLTNPEPKRTWAILELHRENRRVFLWSMYMPAMSRASLFANQLISAGAFWTEVRASEGSVLVERANYYGHDGDDSTALDSLSRLWYLPGGTQQAGFTTTLTLLNPGNKAVTATVTVFTPAGPAGPGTVVQISAESGLNLPVQQIYTGTAPVGCQVVASAPIAAEQLVRFAGFGGGYGMPGSALLSRRWTFAGVETGDPFVTVLALLNPYTESVTVTLTLMSEDGTTLRRPYAVLPGEQVLNLNTILPELALAADVRAGRPIAVARITFFNELSAAHATLGAARPSRRWYLPEGSTGDPFETFLLVANPNGVPTSIDITLLGTGGELRRVHYSMPANARLTVPLNDVLPGVAGFSASVEAEWPVVVERSMYMHEGQGGHSSLGIAR